MSIADAYLAEYESELKTTRKFLERLPEDKLGWRPHEKSKTAGNLALHIATVPGVIAKAALEDQWSPTGGGGGEPASRQQILDTLDASSQTVREALARMDDARMAANWNIVFNGRPAMSVPRAAALRSILFNHWYHHRGQFGVYLRLLGCQVPSSYGPSGDEPPEFMKNN
jgi:uncharacterized damage-inducible protein DinB